MFYSKIQNLKTYIHNIKMRVITMPKINGVSAGHVFCEKSCANVNGIHRYFKTLKNSIFDFLTCSMEDNVSVPNRFSFV